MTLPNRAGEVEARTRAFLTADLADFKMQEGKMFTFSYPNVIGVGAKLRVGVELATDFRCFLRVRSGIAGVVGHGLEIHEQTAWTPGSGFAAGKQHDRVLGDTSNDVSFDPGGTFTGGTKLVHMISGPFQLVTDWWMFNSNSNTVVVVVTNLDGLNASFAGINIDVWQED